ncbi:MAG: molecular chaperone TorD [Desulfobacteraceae bacterium]|nr:MAG: molecular chaperone TorD [Desulfobacteraceae bacterium]
MTFQERVNGAGMKAECYRLLAESYYPPHQGLNKLIEDLAELMVPMHPETAQFFQAMRLENPSMKELIGDYSRLFLGPFDTVAPPYGSVYLDPSNGVMGSSTAHVRDYYLASGLDISDDCGEAPDHISVELEFMHFLCIKEAGAANEGDLEDALHFSRKQEEFIAQSMAWIHEFTERIRTRAGTAFYRGLAECTLALISSHLGESEVGREKIAGPLEAGSSIS